MEDMLCFENIGESTSTLPFLTNSKVDVAGFVNLQRVAPTKKNAFSHFESGQNGGESSYFNLVQELHITMPLLVQSLYAWP
jgi:hypothetical protein